MPFSFNGIGTTYYGKRDVQVDNSFITTEWIIFVYVPIIPIGSFRVKITGNSADFSFYQSTNYLVSRVPLNWRQVRNVYATIAAVVGAFITGIVVLTVIYTLRHPELPTSTPPQSLPSSEQ
jgi:hypothetical protein